MTTPILIFYGSYRRDRLGITLAEWLVRAFAKRGALAELVDARVVDLPMLDRMYKEFAAGTAPPAMTALAKRIEAASGFVFVAGEYNWSVQPGLKNLTDHFLEEWHDRPAAIASYSTTRFGGVRAAVAWHGILAELGMAVVPATLALPHIDRAFDDAGEPCGKDGSHLIEAFEAMADALDRWSDAASRPR